MMQLVGCLIAARKPIQGLQRMYSLTLCLCMVIIAAPAAYGMNNHLEQLIGSELLESLYKACS